MRTRSTTIIAAGVLVAMVGAMTVVAYARSVTRPVAGGTVGALSATRDIPAGAKGADVAKAVRKVAVPKALVPSTAVTSVDALVGRVAVRPITSGEVITAQQFGANTPGAPVSALQIPPGQDAVTMSFPAPQGVGRYVQPGDLVNIFATIRDESKGNPPPSVTKLILSNVLVLSNQIAPLDGSRVVQTSSGDVMLTLSLKPADIERLVFSKENGSLWLALVHPGDGGATTPGTTAATVLR